jgi:hypothetical protein
MNVGWHNCEAGAPQIDPKRPYGNSDVEHDIAEILGWEFIETSDGEMVLTREQGDRARRLHQEMEKALEEFLRTAVLPVGNDGWHT